MANVKGMSGHSSNPFRLLACVIAIAFMFPATAIAASPYAGEQRRNIKSLSQGEIDDYLAGNGMGFAKSAELNGYPGPSHVLELAISLDLSQGQRMRTTQIFERMHARATALGARLVDHERRLDHLFASRTIDRDALANASSAIGILQAELRRTHLAAHLEEASVLTDAQRKRYLQLRGYVDGNDEAHHHHP